MASRTSCGRVSNNRSESVNMARSSNIALLSPDSTLFLIFLREVPVLPKSNISLREVFSKEQYDSTLPKSAKILFSRSFSTDSQRSRASWRNSLRISFMASKLIFTSSLSRLHFIKEPTPADNDGRFRAVGFSVNNLNYARSGITSAPASILSR